MTDNLISDEPKSAAVELDLLRLLIAAKRHELQIRIEIAENQRLAAMNALDSLDTTLALTAQYTQQAIARAEFLDMAIKLAERVAVLEYRLNVEVQTAA